MRRLIPLIVAIFLLLSSKSIFAFPKELFVSFAFPVRELTGIQPTLSLPIAVSKAASSSATPISWYLDYGSLKSTETSQFFIDLKQPRQEVAVLLEVTPGLLTDSKISSGSVPEMLNSYLPADRQKLIDTIFNLFYSRFGSYPQSVYAPYIDSYSLEYLHNHYSLTAAITDPHPGVFPFFTYYPSNQNALVPAQDESHRIKLVLSTFNPPDLFLNPITSQNIAETLKAFKPNQLNQSGRLVLGTANSTPISEYLPEFTKQVSTVQEDQVSDLNSVTVSEFGHWYSQYYPLTSPASFYRSTSDDKTVLYYQNPFYQLKLEQQGNSTQISHLTVFHQLQTEEFRNQRNLSDTFVPSVFPIITAGQRIETPINLNGTYTAADWGLFLADGDKQLKFFPQKLEVKNMEINLPQSPQISGYTFDSSYLPYQTKPFTFMINILKLLALFGVIYFTLRKLGISHKLEINSWLLAVMIIGSATWLITTIFSGSHTIYGLSFWGPQGHDAFVHLSLIESFKHSLWPLNNPTLIDSTVINYHILFDLLTALISRFMDIPTLDLYFRYLPPILAVSIGLLANNLLHKWKFTNLSTSVSLLLIYGAGSLGFIIGGGESVFWSNQAASTLLNPPFALSLVFLLLWLNLFTDNLSWPRVLFLSLLGGVMIQAKSYSAVLLLSSFGLFLAQAILNHKLNIRHFALFLLTILFTGIFLLPTYAPGRSIFIFSPLWFTRSLVSSPDRLPWPEAANALINYPVSGQLLKFILLELLVTIIFFVGNLGIRLFAIPEMIKKNLSTDRLIVNGIIIVGAILPLLLIQTANPWNTIQFFYYSLFFTALLSGPTIVKFLYSFRKLPVFLITLVSLLAIAFTTTALTLRDYVSPTPASFIGYSELNALSLLSSQPFGIVVSPEYNFKLSRSYSDPKPIFTYITTSYISALSGKPSFIADNINLDISNYNFQKESQNQQRLYRTSETQFISDFLKDNNIKYVYENPQFHLTSRTQDLRPIFDSGYFNLYTVTK